MGIFGGISRAFSRAVPRVFKGMKRGVVPVLRGLKRGSGKIVKNIKSAGGQIAKKLGFGKREGALFREGDPIKLTGKTIKNTTKGIRESVKQSRKSKILNEARDIARQNKIKNLLNSV